MLEPLVSLFGEPCNWKDYVLEKLITQKDTWLIIGVKKGI
jgi:hypothetical protein